MAFIDMIVLFVIAVFIIIGVKTGFIRGIIKSTSTYIAVAAAFLLSRPLASILDSNFGFSDSLAGSVTGDGWLNNLGREHGGFMLVAICAVALFVIVKVALLITKNVLSNAAERSPGFNKIDRALGVFFGLFRFSMWAFAIGGVIMLISNFSPNVEAAIFQDSTVAQWVYHRVQDGFEWLIPRIVNGGGESQIVCEITGRYPCECNYFPFHPDWD